MENHPLMRFDPICPKCGDYAVWSVRKPGLKVTESSEVSCASCGWVGLAPLAIELPLSKALTNA